MAKAEDGGDFIAAPGGENPQGELSAEDRLEDATQFRWFHVKAILISGIGFFTDAYDLQVISGVQTMMAMARWPGKVPAAYKGDLNAHSPGSLPTVISLTVSAIALVGTLCGQLIFGYLGDKLGRKGAYGVTLSLMIVMTLLQVAASWGSTTCFLALFLTWRFLLGVGIGGDYPLSAVISSEYASTNLRGPMIAAVFSMQGVGTLCAALVGLAVTAGFRNDIIDNCNVNQPCWPMDAAWRIIMGLGVVPAIATFYLRLKLPESPRFVAQVDHNADDALNKVDVAINNKKVVGDKLSHAENDRITFKSLYRYLKCRRNFLILLGTTMPWFFLDTAYYSLTLFNPKVLQNIGFNPPPLTTNSTSTDMYNQAFSTWSGNATILFCGNLPGYFICVFMINRMGRTVIQKIGFIVMTVTMVIMSAAYPELIASAKWAFIMLYCIMYLFTQFGPNTTTFILPGELNHAKYRASCHGISAAFGKMGAIAGAFGFGWIVTGASNQISTAWPMDSTNDAMQFAVGLLSIMCFMGLLFTFLLPETTGLTLEQIVQMYHDFPEGEELKAIDVPAAAPGYPAEYPVYPVYPLFDPNTPAGTPVYY